MTVSALLITTLSRAGVMAAMVIVLGAMSIQARTDTPPLTIKNLSTTEVTFNSATVIWSTDQPTVQRVEYGTTVAYGSTTVDSTVAATDHAVRLTDLAPGTVYHYRVIARDGAGDTVVVSGDSTFSTARSYLPTGIYALVPTDGPVDARVLAHPDVTGLQIRMSWDALEPANNAFDWSYFDALIAQARAAGKKVSIAVRRGLVGDALPSWLTSEMFECSDGTSGPVPWDLSYQREWIELWRALARRYEDEPTVSMYHLGGLYTWKTADWGLCHGTSSDRRNWLAAGYRIETIQSFALEFAAALSRDTRKPFVFPVAGTMDNTGVVNTAINTNTYIIAPLFARHGPTAATPQFGIMRTTFQGTTPDPQGVGDESALGDQYGTLHSWRPHIAGQRRAIAFDLDELRQMLDISLRYQIQFMELGRQQLLLPGAAGDLRCYRLALEGADPGACTIAPPS